MDPINIDGTLIGNGCPTFVIAEVSANHRQSLPLAKETVIAAAEAGADAVKFQTYTPDTITFKSSSPIFRIESDGPWGGLSLHDLYSSAYLPYEWHEELFEQARALGLVALSTPFDTTAIEFLEELDVPAFKIASLEIGDLPLIQKAASYGKPIILSTGVATLEEVHRAVDACREVGNEQLVVLKCTSSYPAPITDLNLATIRDMSSRFGCHVGYSDHSQSRIAPLVAVGAGAVVVERHIVIDAADGGVDAHFSTDADEFAEIVQSIREADLANGSINYDVQASSSLSRKHMRSLFVVMDVARGDVVTWENVKSIRPAEGMDPALLPQLIGSPFARSVSAGTPLSVDLLLNPGS